MTMVPYIIRAGDYLTSLASRFGFDATAIWNHPQNRDLRQNRINPEVLAPNDILYIPQSPHSHKPLTANRNNVYRLHSGTVHIRIKLTNGNQALADEPCVIQMHGLTKHLRSDKDGHVAVEIPAHIHNVLLVLSQRNESHELTVGYLNPIGEFSGVEARLSNLGFLERPVRDQIDDEQFRRALFAFQGTHNIQQTGELDEATLSFLQTEHGT